MLQVIFNISKLLTMKKSQGKLKLLGCVLATFVISAGLFVNLSSKRSHNCHVHAEDTIQWRLDTTTGYHSYTNENENINWQARPVNVFYLERTSTVRVDCDIYDMTSSADGVLLEDTNASFDFGIGANQYEIIQGDAGIVYRFLNLTCTECGATMQTFDMPINQVGIVVSDYDEASWVYSSNINFHQKNVSSQQFSYTAVPVDLKYDETNHYLKVTCNVSIYDLQNNIEIIYPYQQPNPVFWYEEATCDPIYDGQQQMAGYACYGRCADDQRLEEFDVGSSVSRSLVDLSNEFPSGSGQQEDFSVSIYCNGEIAPEELFVSSESERIVLSAQVSPTQPDMEYYWESTDTSVAQVDSNGSQCLLQIVSTGSSTIIVTATYNNVTATASIRLVSQQQEPETQAEITSLELLENPPSSYYVGDFIDFQNIILVAHYSDDSIKEVTSNDYVAYFEPDGDPYGALVSGDYMLYFRYEGVTTSRGVPIYVNERQPETMASYAVTYYSNGTDEDPHTDYTDRVPEGDEVEYMLLQNMFSRPNYIFLGWSTDSSSQTPNYEEGEKVYLRSNISYYAVWESQEPETQAEITSLELLENPPSYYYVGDYIDFQNIILVAHYSDDSIKEVTSNEYTASFRPEGNPYEPLVSGDYMLYFTYEGVMTESGVPIYVNERQPETYEFEITFNPNNGMDDEIRRIMVQGSSLPLSYDIPQDLTPNYEGHTFLGWYYEGNIYQPGQTIREIYENITLVAQWEEVSSGYTYSVIFNGNGATSGTMDPDTFTSSEYSYDYIFPECRFEREGYEFIGWSFTEQGLIKFKPGQTRNIENGETTFFAIWAEQLTITFDANGGSGYMEPITVASGEKRTVPGCDFTREGYSFVCWAVNSPTSSMTVNPEDQVTVNQNYVLYAVWEQDGPAKHEGMWYDDQSNRLRFYNTDLDEEQKVELKVIVLDFGPNTSLTRAEISAIIYYEDSIWETRSYDMRTFTVGEDSGRQFISGQLDLQDGEGQRDVKLYVETLYNNVMTPGLNYVEGYKQIFYVNAQYDSSVVEFETVKINEITREATLTGYAVDVTGQTDLLDITLTLTNASVNVDEMYGDGQILTGYWAEQKKTIELYVFNVIYNSLEEEPISPETIEEINNGMDKVDLSDEQKQQINDKIDENSDRIGESTGNAISQALDGTTSLISDNPEFAEKQKEVIVIVVETVIDVETNKGSDIGQGREVDSILPDDAGLNVEQEIREFYERQMQELLGGKETPTRSPSRALTSSYKIDVDISGIEDDKVIDHLDNEISLYGNMMKFIDSSVSHMSEAALRIKKCSGEALKVSVKNYVTVVKVSSFREFDKAAADAEFLDNVYRAIMLHMQEQVINTLESEHKDSGNKEKEAVYQEELAAVKDYETFEIMVTEVLRQKYVALTGDETYTQENLEDFFNDVYWPIFKAWALDEEIPQELKDKGINITLEQLTTTTIEQSSSRARNFTVHSDLQNNEIIFLAAFGGGVVLFISLAAIIPAIINKKRARGLVK